MAPSRQIDLEFHPNLDRILVPKIDNQATVSTAVTRFSEEVGLHAGVKQVTPYRPVFTHQHTTGQTGQVSHVTCLRFLLLSIGPAPLTMPLAQIFSQEGGLFVVDLDDEALKLFTPDRKSIIFRSCCSASDSYILSQRSQTKEEEKEFSRKSI